MSRRQRRIRRILACAGYALSATNSWRGSWNRCRGRLCGDSILGLAHGAKACQNVTPEVQEIFKKILVDARDKKTEKGVVKRALERAAAESSIAGTKSSKRQSLINHSFEVGRNFYFT